MAKNVLLIGNGAREHAIAEAIMKSRRHPRLFVYMKANNPAIEAMAEAVEIGAYDSLPNIKNFAQDHGVSLAIIGPEEPLYHGVADALEAVRIPVIGPRKKLARLETSKSFARLLLADNGIPGNPWFRIFSSQRALAHCLTNFFNNGIKVVLKPDGLTGGKGVMVQGDHFETLAEAIDIGEQMLKEHSLIVLEEKLEGEEFSLQCFCDGLSVKAMPPVQDHKRRLTNDKGPNTGGMGSYSCADHLLPFLTRDELDQAVGIIKKIAWAASKNPADGAYKGVIYGGFIATAKGIKLIECNARFGDPEAMNILPLLETDFLDICQAIAAGRLDELDIKFKPLATVVKYVVPIQYGYTAKNQQSPSAAGLIKIGNTGKAVVYHSSVCPIHGDGDIVELHMTSSRALALLGEGKSLDEAEKTAEKGARAIEGFLAHRYDIGTARSIAKRVKHMEELRRI